MQADSFPAQTVIFLVLTVISGAAWSYMVYQHQAMNMAAMAGSWMPSPTPQAWTLTDFTHTLTMWAVMMMPSAMPMVFGFIGVDRLRHVNHPYFNVIAFVGGYFLIWLVFCIIATAAQWQLHTLALLSPMMESCNPTLSAEVIIFAGLYQLTPWKVACLNHCRATIHLSQNCHRRPVMCVVLAARL